jgi:hypothetical protein
MKEGLERVLTAGKELTKAKFMRMKESWLRSLIDRLKPLGLIQTLRAKKELRLVEERKEKLFAAYEKRCRELERIFGPGNEEQANLDRDTRKQRNEAQSNLYKAQSKEWRIRKSFESRRREDQRLLEEAREQWMFIKKEQAREFRQVGLSLGPNVSLEPEVYTAPVAPARLKMTHGVPISRQKAIQRAAREYQVRLLKERCKRSGGENQGRTQIKEVSLSFTPDQQKGRPPDKPLPTRSPLSGDQRSTRHILARGCYRDQVWAQLREIRDLPELSHFRIVQGNQDLSSSQNWPTGTIELAALLFGIKFEVRQVLGDTRSYRAENVTPGHTAKQVWGYLCVQNPDLQEEMILDHSGLVHPGLTIRAAIKRTRVCQTVTSQVIRPREICYEHREIWNMWSPEEVWEHSSNQDDRILPLDCYEVSDKRRCTDPKGLQVWPPEA